MILLSIETSCDETAVAVLRADGDAAGATYTVLGNALISQIDIHRAYGGVFPALAKREHARNLVPLLSSALEEAGMLREDTQSIPEALQGELAELLTREPELAEQFFAALPEMEPPAIDAIAVTAGPGLVPALWVGVNFARALALLWQKPLIAVNHMEGHLLSALATPVASESGDTQFAFTALDFPVLGLLISGGHTEIVSMTALGEYVVLGQTKDDAVGEAFDKVARMLELPYPGGPEVSRLAERARERAAVSAFTLPRPMLTTPDYDFSFSGLKTAVLYTLKKQPALSDEAKEDLAREFEDAVADVLWRKTARALEHTAARVLVLGGGVAGNTHIGRVFQQKIASDFPDVSLRIPIRELTTDNAVMIAMASYHHALATSYADLHTLAADGNWSIAA